MSFKKVTHNLTTTSYGISKKLAYLLSKPELSFDTETRSVYTKEEVKSAKAMLKNESEIFPEDLKLVKLVAKSSGLSFPSLVKTTHFIFGLNDQHSEILIANNMHEEMLLWNFVTDYTGKFIIHNSMFDLKICIQRTGKLPTNFVDTMLLAKTLINNSDIWKSKVGLKDLMGTSYDPKWSLYTDYDTDNLKDEDFINYCAIDGASCYALYMELQEFIGEK